MTPTKLYYTWSDAPNIRTNRRLSVLVLFRWVGNSCTAAIIIILRFGTWPATVIAEEQYWKLNGFLCFGAQVKRNAPADIHGGGRRRRRQQNLPLPILQFLLWPGAVLCRSSHLHVTSCRHQFITTDEVHSTAQARDLFVAMKKNACARQTSRWFISATAK